MTKTVAALFRDYDEAQSAVNELLSAGFDRSAIDMLVNNAGDRFAPGNSDGREPPLPTSGEVVAETLAGAGEGAAIGGLTGLAVGLATLLIPGIGPVLAIGPLAATIFGAELGALGGGIVSVFSGLGLTEAEANHYAEGIRSGGTLVTVQIDSSANARRAADILDRCAPIDLSWGSWMSFADIAEADDPVVIAGATNNMATAPAHLSDPDQFADEGSLTESLAEEDASEHSGIHEYAARL